MYKIALRLGLRQDGLSQQPAAGILYFVVNLSVGIMWFWISRNLASAIQWSAVSMYAVSAWFTLLSAITQHTKASTSRQEVEFLRHLPITPRQLLILKMTQSAAPLAVSYVSLLGIPLGWAIGTGRVSQIATVLGGYTLQFSALSLIAYALSIYLSVDKPSSSRLFVARMAVLAAGISAAVFFMAAPRVAELSRLVLGPILYGVGGGWFGLSLHASGLRAVLLFLAGCLSILFSSLISLWLARTCYQIALTEMESDGDSPRTNTVRGSFSIMNPVTATIWKDFINLRRSWKQQIPGLITSAVFTSTLVTISLAKSGRAISGDGAQVHLVVSLMTAFVVSGVAMVPSLRSIPEDYEIIGIIRAAQNLRSFLWAKTVFATVYSTLVALPFVGGLIWAFWGLPVSWSFILITAVLVCAITSVSGVFVAAVRMYLKGHPRSRDGIWPLLVYILVQAFSVGNGIAASKFGSVGSFAITSLVAITMVGLLILAHDMMETADILA